MTSPQVDPICVRNTHLHHILLGKRHLFEGDEERRQINKDGLIDALLVLYDECNTDFMRKDHQISQFVDKCKFAVEILSENCCQLSSICCRSTNRNQAEENSSQCGRL